MTHRSWLIASVKFFRFWLKDWGLSLRRRKSFSLPRKIGNVSGIYLPRVWWYRERSVNLAVYMQLHVHVWQNSAMFKNCCALPLYCQLNVFFNLGVKTKVSNTIVHDNLKWRLLLLILHDLKMYKMRFLQQRLKIAVFWEVAPCGLIIRYTFSKPHDISSQKAVIFKSKADQKLILRHETVVFEGSHPWIIELLMDRNTSYLLNMLM